jgi:hypothetical protein
MNTPTNDNAGECSPVSPYSAWIDFRTEKPDSEETVLMWFSGLGGTGERGPWVKCDKLRNCIVEYPAFWAHIIPPNDKAHTQKGRERGPDNTQD